MSDKEYQPRHIQVLQVKDVNPFCTYDVRATWTKNVKKMHGEVSNKVWKEKKYKKGFYYTVKESK